MIGDELLPAEELMEERVCPECRGRCYDKYDNPCGTCYAEGIILVLP
jgi:hypothetical protein